MYKYTVLLAPTTAAAQSRVFDINMDSSYRSYYSVSLFAPGLANTEEVAIQISLDQGTTWTNLILSGAARKLTATNNVVPISIPRVTLRVDKPVTVAAVGVYLLGDVYS